VLGVSTRRLEKLARAPPITKLPKSQISQDGPQPRCGGEGLSLPSPRRPAPTRSCWADALVVKVRAAGRTVHVLVVTGVHALGTSERSSASRSPPAKDKAGWLACSRSLMTRGLLRGGARELEIPTRGSPLRSARPGSPGSACRTHYLTGALCQGGGVESSPCVANPDAHHRRCARAPPRSQLEFQRVTEALAPPAQGGGGHLPRSSLGHLPRGRAPHRRDRGVGRALLHERKRPLPRSDRYGSPTPTTARNTPSPASLTARGSRTDHAVVHYTTSPEVTYASASRRLSSSA